MPGAGRICGPPGIVLFCAVTIAGAGPGRKGEKCAEKCSPDSSGLHAVFRKFLRKIMGGVVSAG